MNLADVGYENHTNLANPYQKAGSFYNSQSGNQAQLVSPIFSTIFQKTTSTQRLLEKQRHQWEGKS